MLDVRNIPDARNVLNKLIFKIVIIYDIILIIHADM